MTGNKACALDSITAMNLLQLIEFLGHTTAHAPLDKFLHDHGVKKRPSLQHGGFLIFPKKTGLSLDFTASAENDGILQKSDGVFVFWSVECTLLEDKPDELYKGPLPFGLNSTMNRDSVRASLGSPRITYENGNDKYCIDGLLLLCVYAKDTTQLIRFTIALPDNDDREQGLCP